MFLHEVDFVTKFFNMVAFFGRIIHLLIRFFFFLKEMLCVN